MFYLSISGATEGDNQNEGKANNDNIDSVEPWVPKKLNIIAYFLTTQDAISNFCLSVL